MQKTLGIENEWNGMKNTAIFDKIYEEGVWGKDVDGVSTSGEGSHSEAIVAPYINEISNLLTAINPNTIVDLGCGDFNVGQNFVQLTKKYIACDISNVILERNKRKYRSFTNLEFKILDLSKDVLPSGDLCFVRQVLQHLSNANIENFVKKLNSEKPYKYIVVTEHIPNDANFHVNLNKGTGAATRLLIGSGVVLHKAPFNLDVRNITNLLEVNSEGGKIQTILYEL
jgi:SAM-dependent methyltransferase